MLTKKKNIVINTLILVSIASIIFVIGFAPRWDGEQLYRSVALSNNLMPQKEFNCLSKQNADNIKATWEAKEEIQYVGIYEEEDYTVMFDKCSDSRNFVYWFNKG